MIATLALLLSPEAAACGGFFCNNVDPVEQAGEIVVFEVDPEAGPSGRTTMHVQVEYEGPPIEFAWVVPVKGTPDMFVSNDALFSTLTRVTEPQFYMLWEAEGECAIWDFAMEADAADPSIPAPPNADTDDDGGVTVLAEERVGPYETVTVNAEDPAVLIEWLQANDYQVPDALETTVAPYVADDHNFVALRLAAGEETGDLVPLGLRYEGVEPAIPIQLTSVAATPDMQLVTYVLGPHRAVPSNYLHVELNESAINWFDGAQNYMDVLSRAADEAGGHAFATEFSGSSDQFDGWFYNDSWGQIDFTSTSGPTAFIELVTSSGLPASTALFDLLQDVVPPPEGMDARDVYNCPSCYPELDGMIGDAFDPVAAGLAIETEIIAPLENIDAMFTRASHITRLGSTVSPSEMTLDPMFTFNGDIDQMVSNIHEARLVYQCDEATDDNTYWTAPKDLVLQDGTTLHIPSNEDLAERGLTEAEFLDGLLEPAAATIARTTATGQPELLYDASQEIEDNIDRLNDEADDIIGRSGCSTTGGAFGLWLVGLVPLALRRRR